MSRWLAQALAETGAQGHVPIVPIVPKPPGAPSFGTIGTIGTAPPCEIEERIAMALEGGVPALYAEVFAQMQAGCPAEMSDVRWGRPSTMPGSSSMLMAQRLRLSAGRQRICSRRKVSSGL